MTYRSTPALAVGGIAWLGPNDAPSDAKDCPPGGWRCFHCNEHFTHWMGALVHFGRPGSNRAPECLEAP